MHGGPGRSQVTQLVILALTARLLQCRINDDFGLPVLKWRSREMSGKSQWESVAAAVWTDARREATGRYSDEPCGTRNGWADDSGFRSTGAYRRTTIKAPGIKQRL